MLIPFDEIIKKHNLNITGVIHIGGNTGQEYDDYVKNGINKIVFIEPCKHPFGILKERFKDNKDVVLFQTACGDYTGVTEINVSTQNDGQSSSILVPKEHLNQHKEITFTEKELITVRRLDDLPINFYDYSFLNIDVQGFEAQVLLGALKTLRNIDAIYIEINKEEMYEGCAMVEDIDKILSNYIRVDTSWCGNFGWGDALYLKNKNISIEEIPDYRVHKHNSAPYIRQQLTTASEEDKNPEGNPICHEWMEVCRINRESRKKGVFAGADGMSIQLPAGLITISDFHKDYCLVNRQGQRPLTKKQFEIMRAAYFGNC